jgi:peptide/nickel transport system ATP-binding protein
VTLLSVENLNVVYRQRGAVHHALNNVSISVDAGQTIGLVGESGCGKSTLSKAIMRLVECQSGSIRFAGVDITRFGDREMRPYRRRMQMVFQDPSASLNPRRSVQTLLDVPLRVHGVRDSSERQKRIGTILDAVGLPRNALKRFPHEFSGGQKQRIGIARALILRPELVILDEPVSALDVSIRSQVLNLLVALKQEFKLSYLFISHDLSIVQFFCDEIIVMLKGEVVERGNYDDIWNRPEHVYTKRLLHSIPKQRA